MTPGRLRMRSCIPQKQPPARMAVSVSLPTLSSFYCAVPISTPGRVVEFPDEVEQLAEAVELYVEGVAHRVHAQLIDPAIAVLAQAAAHLLRRADQVGAQADLGGDGAAGGIAIAGEPQPL